MRASRDRCARHVYRRPTGLPRSPSHANFSAIPRSDVQDMPRRCSMETATPKHNWLGRELCWTPSSGCIGFGIAGRPEQEQPAIAIDGFRGILGTAPGRPYHRRNSARANLETLMPSAKPCEDLRDCQMRPRVDSQRHGSPCLQTTSRPPAWRWTLDGARQWAPLPRVVGVHLIFSLGHAGWVWAAAVDADAGPRALLRQSLTFWRTAHPQRDSRVYRCAPSWPAPRVPNRASRRRAGCLNTNWTLPPGSTE